MGLLGRPLAVAVFVVVVIMGVNFARQDTFLQQQAVLEDEIMHAELHHMPTPAEISLREHVASLASGAANPVGAFHALSGGTGQVSLPEVKGIVEATLHARAVSSVVDLATSLPLYNVQATSLLQSRLAEHAQMLAFELPVTCRRLFDVCDLDHSGGITPSEFSKSHAALFAVDPPTWLRVLSSSDADGLLTPAAVQPLLEEWASVLLASFQQQLALFEMSLAPVLSYFVSSVFENNSPLSHVQLWRVLSASPMYEALAVHVASGRWAWPSALLRALLPSPQQMQQYSPEANAFVEEEGAMGPALPAVLTRSQFVALFVLSASPAWTSSPELLRLFSLPYLAAPQLVSCVLGRETPNDVCAFSYFAAALGIAALPKETAGNAAPDLSYLVGEVQQAVLAALPPAASALFSLLDANADGAVEFAEYELLHSVLLPQPVEAEVQLRTWVMRALSLMERPAFGLMSHEQLVAPELLSSLAASLAAVRAMGTALLIGHGPSLAPFLSHALVLQALVLVDANSDGVLDVKEFAALLLHLQQQGAKSART